MSYIHLREHSTEKIFSNTLKKRIESDLQQQMWHVTQCLYSSYIVTYNPLKLDKPRRDSNGFSSYTSRSEFMAQKQDFEMSVFIKVKIHDCNLEGNKLISSYFNNTIFRRPRNFLQRFCYFLATTTVDGIHVAFTIS